MEIVIVWFKLIIDVKVLVGKGDKETITVRSVPSIR